MKTSKTSNTKTRTLKKTRSDAKWNGLSQTQLQKLEAWLFEDNIAYGDALARAKTELGFSGSIGSLKRFYQRREQERLLHGITESRQEALELIRASGNTSVLQSASLKVLAHRFFQQMRHEGIADTATMAKLLLQNEANEIEREARLIERESLELRRQRLTLQKTMWEYDIVKEVNRNVLPEAEELKKLREKRDDPYAENKRLNKIRRHLFGSKIDEPLPENAEEEAAEAAARERNRAENARRHEELLAQMARDQEQRRQAQAPPSRNEPETAARPDPAEPPPKKWEDYEPNHFPFNSASSVRELSAKIRFRTPGNG